jgi:hypothetical protein
MMKLAIVAALLVGIPAAPALSQSIERRITVIGEGSVDARPDRAEFTLGVETRDPSASAALEENTARTSALIEAIRAEGVAEENIATRNISVRREVPGMARDGQEADPVYVVSNEVRVTTGVEGAGALLDAAVNAGANTVSGISFSIAEPDVLVEEARRRAIADAQAKAETMVDAAGTNLGPVLVIREGRSDDGPSPMATARIAMASVPVEPGTQAVSATVTVTFALVD